MIAVLIDLDDKKKRSGRGRGSPAAVVAMALVMLLAVAALEADHRRRVHSEPLLRPLRPVDCSSCAAAEVHNQIPSRGEDGGQQGGKELGDCGEGRGQQARKIHGDAPEVAGGGELNRGETRVQDTGGELVRKVKEKRYISVRRRTEQATLEEEAIGELH
uniref:Uncharacterized protein n=1 Tax=Oryza punctata TaxID=4537 RepID=A0A0E0M0F6_ORYPU